MRNNEHYFVLRNKTLYELNLRTLLHVYIHTYIHNIHAQYIPLKVDPIMNFLSNFFIAIYAYQCFI